MRYELMLPRHIRLAIAENWPIVLPLGVLEYHGEHLAVGMDTLAVVKIFDILETEHSLVILPPFYYGASSYAVEPPERNGSVQVNAENLLPFGKDLFRALLRIGFRNIHGVIHHQTENFAAGMPTDLAFKLAGRQAVFEFLERTQGEGFWGHEKMADYYDQHQAGDNPFNWIQIHPLMSTEITKQYPFDHAGKGETSLMMALCPKAVEIDKLSSATWYTRDAVEASAELGRVGRDLILKHMRACLCLPQS